MKKTHIPKPWTKQNVQEAGFGAVQHAYTKTIIAAKVHAKGVRSRTNTHIPKLLSLRKHQIKGVRSCTHIPKQNHCTISQRIWFGSVQHAYTKTFRLINSPSTLVRSRAKNTYTKTLSRSTIYRILGSALCKYCIYQNVILDNISHHIGSELCK